MNDKVRVIQKANRSFVCPYNYGNYYACISGWDITARETSELLNDITNRDKYSLEDFMFIEYNTKPLLKDINELPNNIKNKVVASIII